MVKSGYKQTEIGVLPEEWEITPLLDKAELLNGLTYTPNDVREYGLLVMRSSNVQNSKFDFQDNVYVNCYVDDSKLIKKNDILICVRNGSSNLIGKCAKADRDYNATFGAFMVVLRGPNNDFVFHLLQQGVIQKHIAKNSDSTINQITNGDIKQIMIPFPKNETERSIISETLSDVDALIDNLEKLIAKKKAIKQGAMQELLTGKRRLPGFSDFVYDIKLGKLCSITTGKKDVNIANDFGIYPFFTCSRKVYFADEYSFDNEAIMIAGNGDVGTLHYYNGKFEAYQRTYVLTNFNCNVDYLYQWLQFCLIRNLSNEKVGSSIPYIVLSQLTEFGVRLPSNDEQLAIASSLTDMDSEIEQLEKNLSKYKKIKSGMMSELLTGRIRLM